MRRFRGASVAEQEVAAAGGRLNGSRWRGRAERGVVEPGSCHGGSHHEQMKKSHFRGDCEKAACGGAGVAVDGISRGQLAISMWLGATGACK
jgi:hypothetical protein